MTANPPRDDGPVTAVNVPSDVTCPNPYCSTPSSSITTALYVLPSDRVRLLPRNVNPGGGISVPYSVCVQPSMPMYVTPLTHPTCCDKSDSWLTSMLPASNSATFCSKSFTRLIRLPT